VKTEIRPLRHQGSGGGRPLAFDRTPEGPHAPAGRRLSRATAARALVIGGVLMVVFALFQIEFSNISEQRSQRAALESLKALIHSGAGLGHNSSGKPALIRKGTAIALLQIPSLGVRQAVVEGSGAEQLKQGPGHLPSTFLPGQPGHAVIAGRRTTYGAAFRKLDLLHSGDEIITTTPYGTFKYRVRGSSRIGPGEADKLSTSTTGLLSLVTSDPPYAPSRALVVDAELVGAPSTAPDPPRPGGQPGEIGFSGNAAATVGVALSGLLLFGALAVADMLYKRWRRWSTYLLTTPIILALLFAWMEGLVSMMPSTL